MYTINSWNKMIVLGVGSNCCFHVQVQWFWCWWWTCSKVSETKIQCFVKSHIISDWVATARSSSKRGLLFHFIILPFCFCMVNFHLRCKFICTNCDCWSYWQTKHLVAAAIALKGFGGLLFIFGNSLGAFLLVCNLCIPLLASYLQIH